MPRKDLYSQYDQLERKKKITESLIGSAILIGIFAWIIAGIIIYQAVTGQ